MEREIEVFINGYFFTNWTIPLNRAAVYVDVCEKALATKRPDDVPNEISCKKFPGRVIDTGGHTGKVNIVSDEIYREGDNFYLKSAA